MSLPVPSAASKSSDGITDILNHPLFMQTSPSSLEGEDNSHILDALSSLAHDGEPDEVAGTFKFRGDEAFREKKHRDALGFYTQAIDAGPSKEILEPLYNNRAACNLALENYGAVLRDTKSCLTINIENMKARYRCAKALFLLDRFKETISFCDSQGELPPDPKTAWDQLKVEAEKGQKKENQRLDRQAAIAQYEQDLQRAVKERGVLWQVSKEVPHSPEFYERQGMDADFDTLFFPVLFLYPAKHTTDLIAKFHEDVEFMAHLEEIFRTPAPWDTENAYTPYTVSIYVPTANKRAIKVGRSLSLRTALDKAAEQGGVRLLQNTINIVIVAKGKDEDDWVEAYKKERAGS